MISNTALIFFSMILLSHHPQFQPNEPFNLDDYRWERRVLIVFAPSDDHPEYQKQLEQLKGRKSGLVERHMLIVHVLPGDLAKLELEEQKEINQQEINQHELRDRFDVNKEQFSVLLIGKDGGTKMRSEQALEIQNIFGRIDSMPMRQREMRNQN